MVHTTGPTPPTRPILEKVRKCIYGPNPLTHINAKDFGNIRHCNVQTFALCLLQKICYRIRVLTGPSDLLWNSAYKYQRFSKRKIFVFYLQKTINFKVRALKAGSNPFSPPKLGKLNSLVTFPGVHLAIWFELLETFVVQFLRRVQWT